MLNGALLGPDIKSITNDGVIYPFLKFMAVDAEPHLGLCTVSEQLHKIRTMRIVAAAAVELFARPFGVCLVFVAEGMAFVGKALDNVRLRLHIRVAAQTQGYGRLAEQGRAVGRMRPMA